MPPRIDDALYVLTATWSLLLAAHLSGGWISGTVCDTASFTAAGVLLMATRRCSTSREARRAGRNAEGRRRRGRSLRAFAFAAFCGVATYPGWVVAIALLGSALGLDPPGSTLHERAGFLDALNRIVLAPVFEELLYRERLLLALQPRCGAAAAIVVASAAFALPHASAWGMLGTFTVGLAMGGWMLARRSVGECIAYHAGLNAVGGGFG